MPAQTPPPLWGPSPFPDQPTGNKLHQAIKLKLSSFSEYVKHFKAWCTFLDHSNIHLLSDKMIY